MLLKSLCFVLKVLYPSTVKQGLKCLIGMSVCVLLHAFDDFQAMCPN